MKISSVFTQNVSMNMRVNDNNGINASIIINISDEIDGSVTFYTITYSDSASGSNCGSATIPASSCEVGICSNVFEVSSSSCPPSTMISVVVLASNVLGNSSSSRSTYVG